MLYICPPNRNSNGLYSASLSATLAIGQSDQSIDMNHFICRVTCITVILVTLLICTMATSKLLLNYRYL